MSAEMIVCIPGPWASRSAFLQAVVDSTGGEFLCAGVVLAHTGREDHVEVDFEESSEEMADAFGYAGQGKLSDATLEKVAGHNSAVYMHFPVDIAAQRMRIAKFTEVIAGCGGFAVKVESSGVAHEWDVWRELLASDEPFDQYRACVVLTGDDEHYYSCGMHHFELADVQVSNELNLQEAAALMNQFNHYQMVARPDFESGSTFSLTKDSAVFELQWHADDRHPEEDLFHNPQGVWHLTPA